MNIIPLMIFTLEHSEVIASEKEFRDTAMLQNGLLHTLSSAMWSLDRVDLFYRL